MDIKKKRIKIIAFIGVFIFCSLNSVAQEFSFSDFEGIWKKENSDTYEVWTKKNENELKGASYKLMNGAKRISENLKLSKSGNKIQYRAQVLNQNNAQWISFDLNTQVKDKLSFENLDHDFPKKIQYTFIVKNKLFVEIKGENDNGFSFYLLRIEE